MNIVDIANYRVTSGQESDTHSDFQIIEKLLSMVRSLQTCEKWLQGQVADRDATIESLRWLCCGDKGDSDGKDLRDDR